MSRLFVNIDHIATIRNQRGTKYPNLITAATICEQNGAEGITVHLREDRRHIKDADVFMLKENINSFLNFEMAVTDEMLKIAKKLKPHYVCLVPEKREELTTEGGLNLKNNFNFLKNAIAELKNSDILVSLFIEPDLKQIELAKALETDIIEIHTGTYCNNFYTKNLDFEFLRIKDAVKLALNLDIKVNLGHGLDYINIKPLLSIKEIGEYNIGHSIISNSIFLGLATAVRNMNELIRG